MTDLFAEFESPEEATKPPPVPVVVPSSLRELDVETELLEQYRTAKQLLANAEENVPLNQRAQALNSITTILQTITKMQTDLYDAERLKTLEAILLDTLREFPQVQEAFLEVYKRRLNVQ